MKKADQIILGKIYTLDSDKFTVEAAVVCEKKIVYLGSKEVAMKMKGDATLVLDYGDAVIYPGFIDAHTHPTMAGQLLALVASLYSGNCMSDYVETMKSYMEENPGRDYYYGIGWVKYEEPTKEMLDAIAPDVPMILKSTDQHSMWLNSAALKACGFDKALAAKYGPALVHVDEEGNPSGLICELAQQEVNKRFSFSLEDTKKGLLAWQEFAFSQGITAVGEALLDSSPVNADAYKELIDEGKWKLRTYAFPAFMKTAMTDPASIGELLKETAKKYNSEYLKIVGAKVIVDGVIEAHTGYLLEDYNDQPGYRGITNIKDPSLLLEEVRSANNAGFSVHFHTIGDAAAKMAIDCIQTVEEETGNFDLRNSLAHLQVIRPEDIKRCGDYNIGAVVAPLWAAVVEPFYTQSVGYLGEERAWAQYPVKAFEDAGVTMGFHTDFPVSSAMNLPKTVYMAITRGTPEGGEASVLNKNEAISAFRSLLAMTANIAYLFRAEDTLGTLAIGKAANFSVYDRDFIDYDDVNAIPDAKLIATVVDGEEVYHS